MPFNLDFSSSRGALQRLQQFLIMDRLNKRASERQQVEDVLRNALQRGTEYQKYKQDVSLEDLKTSNEMKKAHQAAILAMAQTPSLDAWSGYLNLYRMGQLGPEEKPLAEAIAKEYVKGVSEIGDISLKVVKGEASAEELGRATHLLGTKLGSLFGPQMSANIKAKEQLEIDRRKNEIDAMRANTEAQKYPDWLKNQSEFLDKTMAAVAQQGVTPLAGSVVFKLADVLGKATGRAYSTIPEKLYGQLQQTLAEIRQNTMVPGKERPFTELERMIVNEAWNPYKLKAQNTSAPTTPPPKSGTTATPSPDSGYGNLLNPKTGMRQTDASVAAEESKRAVLAVTREKIKKVLYPPLSPSELVEYKNLEQNWATLTPEQKQRYHQLEQRAWWVPSPEENAFLDNQARLYYNLHLLKKGEEPLPVDESITMPTGQR